MSVAPSFLNEVEDFLERGSGEQRADVLRRVTDLFLGNAKEYAEEQVALFDDVMSRLMTQLEDRALARLGQSLAPVDNAPLNVIRQLSRHDEIAVAGPVIEQSDRLTDEDLVEIANTKTQAHLGAIADRRTISPAVTDVLVVRGDRDVARKVAGNAGAAFSASGFARLTSRAENDDELAERVATRTDVPADVFEKILVRATETVRTRLLAHADAETQERIQLVLARISSEVSREASADRASGRAARTLIRHDPAQLRTQVADAAGMGRAQEVAGALSLLTDAPPQIVQRLVRQGPAEAVLVLCKAAGLGWPVTKSTLALGPLGAQPDEAPLKALFEQFLKLSADNAQRTVRFLKVRKTLSAADLGKLLEEQRD